MGNSPSLLRVRDFLRLRQMAYATEKTYCYWIRYFIRQQKIRHPDDMDADKLTAFLTFLAVHRHVSPNTQNQAFNALLFLFRHVLQRPLENIQAIRAKRKALCAHGTDDARSGARAATFAATLPHND